MSRRFPCEEGIREFIPFGDIIQAKDGTLCVSGYAQTPGITGYTYHCYFLRSRDDGHTWAVESTIAKDHNETAFANCPTERGSPRRGSTAWTSMRRAITGRHGSRGARRPDTTPRSLPPVADGRLLLTHGDRRPGARGVGMRLSSDGGITWSSASTPIASSLSGDCGYPSSVQLPNGRILTAYYSQRTPTHPRYHMAVVFWNVDEVFTPILERCVPQNYGHKQQGIQPTVEPDQEESWTRDCSLVSPPPLPSVRRLDRPLSHNLNRSTLAHGSSCSSITS